MQSYADISLHWITVAIPMVSNMLCPFACLPGVSPKNEAFQEKPPSKALDKSAGGMPAPRVTKELPWVGVKRPQAGGI